MNDTAHDSNPWHDPIVAEVRGARQALFAAADYDIREFCRRLREQQASSGHPVVSLAPRSSSDKPAMRPENRAG
jgi:hypothetical protein